MNKVQYDIRALVVGCGSIGRRHLRNLNTLGVRELVAVDPDENRLAEVVNTLPVRGFADYNQALDSYTPDMVLVCTPPVLHVTQAFRALEAGAHVFIEKPLSCSLDGLEELQHKAMKLNRDVRVGYNLRYHPGISRIKSILDEQVLGKVLWAYIEFGQYLPDWRPWQDYRKTYTARKDLGGGIVLDDTHEIDYPIWFFGAPRELLCSAYQVSGLEMDVEDSADILLRFENGVRTTLHMDCMQRSYSRSCRITGEEGTINWNYMQNRVELYTAKNKEWQWMDYQYDSNEMYLLEIKDAVERIINAKVDPENLDNAVLVLKTALLALRSSEEKRWFSLSEKV